jgi:hypothetical protein
MEANIDNQSKLLLDAINMPFGSHPEAHILPSIAIYDQGIPKGDVLLYY